MTDIDQLLQLIAQGNQDEAELFITHHGETILRKKGSVTDLAKRNFDKISPFQFSLWSFDWRMWGMILHYLDCEEAFQQLSELKKTGTQHGTVVNWNELITSLETYNKNWFSWTNQQCIDQWVKKVGGAQLKLPVHVVNEYCNPDQSFIPCPDFLEPKLKRSRHGDAGDWFEAKHLRGGVGTAFAWTRANREKPGAGRPGARAYGSLFYWGKQPVLDEVKAIIKLQQVANEKLQNLELLLDSLMKTRAIMEEVLPIVIIRIVLRYLLDESKRIS